MASKQPTFYVPPPTSGPFWDMEEVRHQEGLHRVSYADYLRRHSNDSEEAGRLYSKFLRDQNRWLVEQAELREKEAQRALEEYSQRAERWNQQWKGIVQGKTVSEVLEKTGTAAFPVPPITLNLSTDSTETESPSVSIRASQSCTTLCLPHSALGFETTRFSGQTPELPTPTGSERTLRIDQTDGAAGSKNRLLKATPVKGERVSIKKHRKDPIVLIDMIQPPKEVIPRKYQASAISVHSSTGSTSSSSNSNPSNQFPLIMSFPPILNTNEGPSLAGGKIQKIISHKPWGTKGRYLYNVLWKSGYSQSVSPVEWWVKTSDLLGSKLIVEEYHIRNQLGPVFWPKSARRQKRSSASLGVREIKEALEERKTYLKKLGVYDEEASRELVEERWKIRDEWQRRGRSWGTAKEVVQERKKAWKKVSENKRVDHTPPETIRFLDGVKGVRLAEQEKKVFLGKLEHKGDSRKKSPTRIRSHPLLRSASFQQNQTRMKLPPLLRAQTAGDFKNRSQRKGICKKRENFTARDEKEWRKHFLGTENMAATFEDDPVPVELTSTIWNGRNRKKSKSLPSLPKVSSTLIEPNPVSLMRIDGSEDIAKVTIHKSTDLASGTSENSFGLSKRQSLSIAKSRPGTRSPPEAPARPSTPENGDWTNFGPYENAGRKKQGFLGFFSRIFRQKRKTDHSKIPSPPVNPRVVSSEQVNPAFRFLDPNEIPSSNLEPTDPRSRRRANVMKGQPVGVNNLSRSNTITRHTSQNPVKPNISPAIAAYFSYDGAAPTWSGGAESPISSPEESDQEDGTRSGNSGTDQTTHFPVNWEPLEVDLQLEVDGASPSHERKRKATHTPPLSSTTRKTSFAITRLAKVWAGLTPAEQEELTMVEARVTQLNDIGGKNGSNLAREISWRQREKEREAEKQKRRDKEFEKFKKRLKGKVTESDKQAEVARFRDIERRDELRDLSKGTRLLTEYELDEWTALEYKVQRAEIMEEILPRIEELNKRRDMQAAYDLQMQGPGCIPL